MKEKIEREPAMIGGLLVAVVEMFLLMMVQLGWVNWNSEQLASINNFVVALVSLLIVAIPVATSYYYVRGRVTPVANPHTVDGYPANLVKKE